MLKQQSYQVFEASLSYIVSSGPALAISKSYQLKKMEFLLQNIPNTHDFWHICQFMKKNLNQDKDNYQGPT